MIKEDGNKMTFQEELENLINKHSIENGSNTPDYILAKFLNECLENFNNIIRLRENHYGRELKNLSKEKINLS
jgi:hypothetical protein